MDLTIIYNYPPLYLFETQNHITLTNKVAKLFIQINNDAKENHSGFSF